ncbi:hypothetical protein [Leptospira borgpetersenii]|uniref:hypothetical protein n=1 Tax=Leptospira borgpetersenii TaxID=174 RepID=UPI0002BF9696|nr:hypothetical protein [Leptospira borgpetersenii]AXX15247.1 hypothetical protein C4Q31_06495 [Leptospira borgpetersenii serovar Ceylonica]EMN56413.1 hypothetical protein LEP1GSC090_3554 [Leptospira borgpetersenii serovar Javanica str. MK146]QVK48281.1 hypothetical protein FH601_02710 [Leptospira borgpetersenii]QVK50351.1 hypothetical protein FH600_11525 [Leptospira borgpetersenii]QVK53536.1 hypothetical protein FH599_11515 [Leptospira borgpetersenii]
MSHLEKIVDRYGGWKLWDRLDFVEFYFRYLGGPLPLLKGLGKTFGKYGNVRVFPKKFIAEFLEYPAPGKKIVFQNGKVRIFNADDDPDTFTISNYRDSFRGLRKYRRWNSLDASYFFGYAVTQYLSVPFILKEYTVREVELADGGVHIDVEFPQYLHTHCEKQSYRFDKEGLLVRNDYTADIVGPWAKGAHFTTHFQEIGGLPIPTKRNVFVRLGGFVTPIPVLSAELKPLKVHFR